MDGVGAMRRPGRSATALAVAGSAAGCAGDQELLRALGGSVPVDRMGPCRDAVLPRHRRQLHRPRAVRPLAAAAIAAEPDRAAHHPARVRLLRLDRRDLLGGPPRPVAQLPPAARRSGPLLFVAVLAWPAGRLEPGGRAGCGGSAAPTSSMSLGRRVPRRALDRRVHALALGGVAHPRLGVAGLRRRDHPGGAAPHRRPCSRSPCSWRWSAPGASRAVGSASTASPSPPGSSPSPATSGSSRPTTSRRASTGRTTPTRPSAWPGRWSTTDGSASSRSSSSSPWSDASPPTGACRTGPLVVDLDDASVVERARQSSVSSLLGDPTARLVWRRRDTWIDAAGEPVVTERRRPVAGADRGRIRRGVRRASTTRRRSRCPPQPPRRSRHGCGCGIVLGRRTALASARLVELRALQRALVDAQDAARRRVERDLHDGAQQRLVGLALEATMAARNGDSQPRSSPSPTTSTPPPTTSLPRPSPSGRPPSNWGSDAGLATLAATATIPVDVAVHGEHATGAWRRDGVVRRQRRVGERAEARRAPRTRRSGRRPRRRAAASRSPTTASAASTARRGRSTDRVAPSGGQRDRAIAGRRRDDDLGRRCRSQREVLPGMTACPWRAVQCAVALLLGGVVAVVRGLDLAASTVDLGATPMPRRSRAWPSSSPSSAPQAASPSAAGAAWSSARAARAGRRPSPTTLATWRYIDPDDDAATRWNARVAGVARPSRRSSSRRTRSP